MTAAASLLQALPIVREKRLATVRARCALIGACLWPTTDDHGREAFILSRGPLTIELASLDAVEARLDEAGAT